MKTTANDPLSWCTPEQRAQVEQANRKGVAGFRKQFVKKASAQQCLDKLYAEVSSLLAAYYSHPAGPDYPRAVSDGMRALKAAAADVRFAVSPVPSVPRSAVSGQA